MFKQITIIGFGLIGSSIARGIRKHNLAEKIICGDVSQEVCNKVAFLKLADACLTDLSVSVKGSDLVIICTPVGKMGEVAEIIASNLKSGAIVTDVGSVKKSVVSQIQPHIPSGVHFVPGHPVAGREVSGPEGGLANLFEGRWCILTPLPHTELKAVERLTLFWEGCGADVEIMDMDHHDLVLAITSHLPHLIAYSTVGTATNLEGDIKSEVIKYSASGFRDFTRLAASDPTMWRDVFLHNKNAVLEMLQRFTEDLTELQKAIRKGDGDYLYNSFAETRDIRSAIVDAGQAEPEDMKLIKK